MENKDNIIHFGCKHCENTDMKYFQFNSLEVQTEQWKNNPYKSNWNRETTPKIPVGIHLKCAKCNKDTFIIPNIYNPTEWGNDIPQQCIVNVTFEKPEFSAIQYVLTDDGFLDKIVLTANNEKLSLITQKNIKDNIKVSVIGKSQYDLLLSRGLKEVGEIDKSKEEDKKNNKK